MDHAAMSRPGTMNVKNILNSGNCQTIWAKTVKKSVNISYSANLANNGLTNVMTRLTLAATGIDLLARRGISLADT